MSATQTFNQALANIIERIGDRRTFSKGSFLLKEGQIEQNIYFIESGALRIFRIDELEEQTVRLGYEGSFITSLSSYLRGKPSEFYIEAIRKSTLRIVAKDRLTEFIFQNSENVSNYCAFLENLVVQQIEREIDLLTTSTTTRLKRVLERSPDLFQQVPLKYIASYLRMKPETLSRIRKY